MCYVQTNITHNNYSCFPFVYWSDKGSITPSPQNHHRHKKLKIIIAITNIHKRPLCWHYMVKVDNHLNKVILWFLRRTSLWMAEIWTCYIHHPTAAVQIPLQHDPLMNSHGPPRAHARIKYCWMVRIESCPGPKFHWRLSKYCIFLLIIFPRVDNLSVKFLTLTYDISLSLL